ncbi:unnamed protein product, partial [Prorocentrum cordatum]
VEHLVQQVGVLHLSRSIAHGLPGGSALPALTQGHESGPGGTSSGGTLGL